MNPQLFPLCLWKGGKGSTRRWLRSFVWVVKQIQLGGRKKSTSRIKLLLAAVQEENIRPRKRHQKIYSASNREAWNRKLTLNKAGKFKPSLLVVLSKGRRNGFHDFELDIEPRFAFFVCSFRKVWEGSHAMRIVNQGWVVKPQSQWQKG